MPQRDLHYNATVFPEPRQFDPERWVKSEESQRLEKHLVSFSKRPRM
jgi:cytochrome P450